MANRLVLTFLFVMLAGGFMGTYAQNTTASTNTTIAPANATTALSSGATAPSNVTTALANATTAPANATTALSSGAPASTNTTTAPANATTAPSSGATAPSNVTTALANATTALANATTAPANATTAPANATTAPANATTAPSSGATAPSNVTTALANATTALANATTALANATTAPANATTAPANATTAPANGTTSTTTAPSIIPNTTVTNLTETISASNCSKTQLCARQPSKCDPTTGTECFFLGVRKQSGQNFGFALSGESDGYIAAILSRTTTLGNNDITYICARNNGAVKYISAIFNNGKLTNTTLPVNNVRGKVNGNKIECTFDATVPDSSTRAAASYSLSVATGTYSASNDNLGNPSSKLTTPPLDLTNPSANNAVTIQQSLMQALLIAVGVLSLTML